MPEREPDWLRLDNAAKIYPPAYSDRAPEVFRVGVTLVDPVRLEALQRALATTISRCPYYQVHLRRGLFWYYLQRHETPPRVELLGPAPVSSIRMRSQTAQLFRVFARENMVRIDFSHVLTDGFGAFRFLSTMIAEYLRNLGVTVPSGGLIMDPNEVPAEEEFADAYPEISRRGTPKPDSLGGAYHIPGPFVPGFHRTLTGKCQVEAALEVARKYNASLTEFLAGVYIHCILQSWKTDPRRSKRRTTIRLQVPADMRRIHQSKTMRNFSLFVAPEIDVRLGDYTLPELVDTVHHMMHLQLDPRILRRQASRNVSGEQLALVRIIPLILKDWYLSSLHHKFGGNVASGVISNLGNISYPQAMAEHVSDVSFVLGPNPTLRKAVTAVGFDDHLNVTIGSVVASRELERLFFTTMSDEGIPVQISEQST